jgi:hypothetical protein
LEEETMSVNTRQIARIGVCAAGLMAGCLDDDGGPTHGDGGGTGGDCVSMLTVPPDGHPNPAGVFTGITVEDEGYTRFAVGHVDDDADESGCCQDYALASGPNLNTVRVVFGASGNGLQAFADQSDEVITIASRIDDIVMADFNDDGRNDIAVVRNGFFDVVYNTGNSSPPFFGQPQTYGGSSGSARAGRSLAAIDVTCDGRLDLIAASMGTNHIMVLRNFGTSFGWLMTINAGIRVQRLVVADVNNDGIDDVIASSDDGRVAVYLLNCFGYTTKGPYEVFPNTSTPGMAVAAGRVCPDHPDDIAIAAGWWDVVRVMCGDGSGEYDNVVEEHGQQQFDLVDYWWSMWDGSVSNNHIADIAFWSPARELYVLHTNLAGSQLANSSAFRQLIPHDCQGASKSLKSGELRSGGRFERLSVHTEGVSGSTEWDRFAVVGAPGLGAGR